MRRISLLLLIACVGAIAFVCGTASSADPLKDRQQWEYKVCSIRGDAVLKSVAWPKDPATMPSFNVRTEVEMASRLNDLGRDGWELAAMVSDSESVPGPGDVRVSVTTLYLKRQK